jgi:hypothetical protein
VAGAQITVTLAWPQSSADQEAACAAGRRCFAGLIARFSASTSWPHPCAALERHFLVYRSQSELWHPRQRPGENIRRFAENASAVGFYCVSGCATASETDRTLILHWNGTD